MKELLKFIPDDCVMVRVSVSKSGAYRKTLKHVILYLASRGRQSWLQNAPKINRENAPNFFLIKLMNSSFLSKCLANGNRTYCLFTMTCLNLSHNCYEVVMFGHMLHSPSSHCPCSAPPTRQNKLNSGIFYCLSKLEALECTGCEM